MIGNDGSKTSPYQPPDEVHQVELQRAGNRQRLVIQFVSTMIGMITTSALIIASAFLTFLRGWNVSYLMLVVIVELVMGVVAAGIARRSVSFMLGVRSPRLQDEHESLQQRLKGELERFQNDKPTALDELK